MVAASRRGVIGAAVLDGGLDALDSIRLLLTNGPATSGMEEIERAAPAGDDVDLTSCGVPAD